MLWVIAAVIVTMIARSKGRPAFGWFVYGFLIWPIALVHALLLKSDVDAVLPAPSQRAIESRRGLRGLHPRRSARLSVLPPGP